MSVRAKPLSALLAGLVPVEAKRDLRVQDIAIDSRAVTPGTLFLALPGERHDGRAFITDAVARGAVAVVYDTDGATPPALDVPAFGIPRLASQLGTIASRFFDAPSHALVVIGVTGTNGKTTSTQLLAQALNRAGERCCAIVGTLGYGFPDALAPATHTTPDAASVQRLLATFRAAGARYVSMEVSSHALDQGRVHALRFAVAVFTNLTRDHLDYHGDMERYAAAKTKLFLGEDLEVAVINADDAHGRRLIEQLAPRLPVLSYGRAHGDVHARTLECTREGLRLVAHTPQGEVEIRAPLLGEFNALNLLAVLATLLALGIPAADAAQRLDGVQPVAGRAERFAAAERPLVVVDYAHTPDALEQILTALRAHTDGSLWCVFGCGGNRDKGKRPQMGEIAERLADRIIVTDDNPRHEPGDAIVADIAAGMKQAPRVIRDRKRAIATAIAEAAGADVVLVAGKGHEDYQEVGDVRHAYSDRETVRSLLGIAA